MTDTYNDTTGSRKKFLIPLVVLLLCAVSLTGAGYAYNSSVQGNGGADVDEKFVIDLYDPSTGDAISGVIDAGAIDGLVFATKKVASETPSMYGLFELEGASAQVYKGMVRVNTSNNLAATSANVTLSGLTVAFEGTDYTVVKAVEPGADILTYTFKVYEKNGANLGDEVVPTGSVYALDLDTDYYYVITITGVNAKVASITADQTAWDADAFADNVLDDVKVNFGFTFTAAPVTV